MVFKVNIRMTTLAILFFLNYGIGCAESEIPTIFKYELPTVNKNYSHTVTFTHATHAMTYKISCAQCHHTLEPGALAVEETCVDCHDNTGWRRYFEARYFIPEAERYEYHILALHDQCINCHKDIKQHNRSATPPVACWGCHTRKKK